MSCRLGQSVVSVSGTGVGVGPVFLPLSFPLWVRKLRDDPRSLNPQKGHVKWECNELPKTPLSYPSSPVRKSTSSPLGCKLCTSEKKKRSRLSRGCTRFQCTSCLGEGPRRDGTWSGRGSRPGFLLLLDSGCKVLVTPFDGPSISSVSWTRHVTSSAPLPLLPRLRLLPEPGVSGRGVYPSVLHHTLVTGIGRVPTVEDPLRWSSEFVRFTHSPNPSGRLPRQDEGTARRSGRWKNKVRV